MLSMTMDFAQLEREQEAAVAAVTTAITKAEADIAALSQDLKPEVLQQRAGAIRDATHKAVEERVQALRTRAGEARELQRRFTPEAERRRAKFHADPAIDATMRLAAFTTL